MIDIQHISSLISSQDAPALAELIKHNVLKIQGDKLTIVNSTEVENYWNKRQLVRKILLNSALTHTNWRPYIARYIE